VNGPVQIGQIDEEPGRDDSGCDVDLTLDRTVVISDLVGSMALRQQGWKDALRLIREHNVVATDVARNLCSDPDAGDCEILEYIGDATVIAFDDANTALRCAWQIRRDLAAWSEDHAAQQLQARISLAHGEIMRVIYRGVQPHDWQGRPIDIAAKLISDVARPGQVVVHETAAKRVAPATLGVELRPLEGEELPIESEAQNARVFEVLAKDAEYVPLASRRRLIIELTAAERQTHELKLTLEQLLGSLDEALRTGKVNEARGQMRAVEFVVRDLQQAWANASEIEKTLVTELYKAVGEDWSELQGVWRREQSTLRVEGEEDRRGPARRCHQAAGSLVTSAEALDQAIHNAIDAIWPQA
jgi:hypothetical protein